MLSRVTTTRAPSLLNPYWMLFTRRLMTQTACRNSSHSTLLTTSGETLDPVWEHFSSPRSGRSTRTGSWTPTRLYHQNCCLWHLSMRTQDGSHHPGTLQLNLNQDDYFEIKIEDAIRNNSELICLLLQFLNYRPCFALKNC